MKTSLVYSTSLWSNGLNFNIQIRLDDQCKNGHQDFSITGEYYPDGRKTQDCVSGAIGDEIAKHFPQFKIFNDLHLCDWKGAPMHSVANGVYHIQNSGKAVSMEYLRITDDEYEALKHVENEGHLAVLLIQMGVKARWENEAKEAIAELERLTGETFLCDSVREQFPAADKIAEWQKQLESGYFEPEAVAQRKADALAAKIAKKRDAITTELAKKVGQLNEDAQIRLAVLDLGILSTNFIHYTHNSTLVINWMETYDLLNESEIEAFTAMMAVKFPAIGVSVKNRKPVLA